MRSRVLAACLVLSLPLAIVTGAVPATAGGPTPEVKDDFTKAELEGRRTMRGDWKVADGVATVTQDDELYKKYNNHGPIVFYDTKFDDATISFAFKADKAKQVVFTANGEGGHVLRVAITPTGTTVRAFPTEGESAAGTAATKPAAGAKAAAEPPKSVTVGTLDPKLADGQWTKVTVAIAGPKATVTVGEASVTAEHPTFARPKTNVSVGFSFGTLAVKDVAVRP